MDSHHVTINKSPFKLIEVQWKKKDFEESSCPSLASYLAKVKSGISWGGALTFQ